MQKASVMIKRSSTLQSKVDLTETEGKKVIIDKMDF
jgi:hypothetical protein